MTKRRPWWSERWQWAAGLVGGLLLLNVSPLWAASGQASAAEAARPAGKPALRPGAAKVGKKPVRTPLRSSRAVGRNNPNNRHHDAAPPEVLAAEIRDDQTTGLHGAASFYGQGFRGRRTATGDVFKVKEFTAASNLFPLGSKVAVRRLDNNLCAIVTVNDRMHAKHRRRIIDVSRGVAEYLDMVRAGVVLVRVALLNKAQELQGPLACQAAFEAEVPACEHCAAVQRLPEIGSETQ